MVYYVVDAFTDALFHGNPAGICVLEYELADETMQRIAAENNLSETAFLIKRGDGYSIRWFTPAVEVDLCGHATLGASWVVLNELEPGSTAVRFESRSGALAVARTGERYTLDFPSRKPQPVEKHALLEQALGCPVLETCAARDLIVVVDSEKTVQVLRPDMALLRQVHPASVVVTAKGETCDFVSRCFAPNLGVDEDPVTGSTHSTLIPFWSERLGKTELVARQLSARGGTLFCRDAGPRVEIGGNAVCYLKGSLLL